MAPRKNIHSNTKGATVGVLVRMTPELREALHRVAAAKELSLAEECRRVLTAHVEREAAD